MPTWSARLLRALIIALGCLAFIGAPEETKAPTPPPRPALLMPMYVSFAGLNALDVHSTYRVLGNGGREANPVVGGVVGSPAAMIALKAGTTAAAIMASERLRQRHPKAAAILMTAFNSAMAAIVAHNYAVAAR
jgi:hypothetical protein